MMRRFLTACSLLLVICGVGLRITAFAATPAATCDPTKPQSDVFLCACTQNADATKDAVACKSTGEDPIGGSRGIFANAEKIIALAAGIAAVFIIIFSGIRMVLANGESSKVATARNAIIYSLIGLVIIIIAHTIVVFVLKGLH